MKHKTLLAPLIFGLIVASLEGAETRPNIIFLFTDDQTVGTMGCEGNNEIITPHLDQLASEGVRFTNHYNTTAVCMASRCNVLTGLYEYRHGCNFSHGDLERKFFEESYAARLREAGFFTGFAGKIGFVLKNEPFEVFENEFDVWAGGPGQTEYATAKNKGIAQYAAEFPHCSRAYGAWAKDFLKSARASGKPFCMSISFKAPHLPFDPDPIDMKLYEGKTFTKPDNYGVANGEHLSPQSKTSRAATGYREWITDYDESMAAYCALITGVDAAVGMIREGLEQEGFSENTVIIYTSDNGYSRGAHGFGDKVLPYEEASKSPLIIFDPRLPGGRAGQVSDAVTGNVDMAATIFDLAGVEAPGGMDGKSLLPIMTQDRASVREALPLFNHWGISSAHSMAVVTPDWKFVYWYWGKGMDPTEELFHLSDNRHEMANVIANPDHAAVLADMRAAYDKEVALLKTKVNPGHGYATFPVLFDRSIPWEDKASQVPNTDSEAPVKGKGKKSKKAE